MQDLVEPISPVDSDVLLKAESITRRFPGVVANDNIDFVVRRGTVHCLLGENGAGKSTLAEILYGVHVPDSGYVEFRGERLSTVSPRDAIARGIGLVRQHFELVAPMTVVENILIGTRGDLRVGFAAARERIEQLRADYDLDLDLDTPVEQLSVGEQQWVEILKAIYLGADLLILDEPTAVLTPAGIERLFDALRAMCARGLTIVLITHKLKEVLAIADEVTALRKGKVAGTLSIADADTQVLTRMMVGRDVDTEIQVTETKTSGDEVLSVKELSISTPSGRGSLRSVSLTARGNEVVGVAGVAGNGQDMLFDAIVGVAAPESGSISIAGLNAGGCSPAEFIDMGVASVPADRIHQGLLMDFDISENLILGDHRSSRFSRRGWLRRRQILDFAAESFTEFEIAAPSTTHVTRVLSGGNLQKIVLARELAMQPKLLVAHQPTRGLDIAAANYVRRRLIDESERGCAVVLISDDLDELLAMSTRIVVMFDGRIVGDADRALASREQVGRWMAGLDIESLTD